MSASRDLRWWPAAGVLFAVLYLVAFPLMDLPDGSSTDAQVARSYEDAGTRTGIVAGALLLFAAGLVLLPFLAGLRARLGRGVLADVAAAGGGLYAVLLIVATSLQSGYAFGIAIGELPRPVDPTLARVLSDQGFGLLLLPGLWAAGVLILASTAAARRAGALPPFLVVCGFVIAPLMLAGAAWVPQFLVPLWVLGVSVACLRRPHPVAHRERGWSRSATAS